MLKFCNQAPKSAWSEGFLWDTYRFLSLLQTQGENAPSQLVLYHYPDLQKEKGIVLMTAEMDSKFLVREVCSLASFILRCNSSYSFELKSNDSEAFQRPFAKVWSYCLSLT